MNDAALLRRYAETGSEDAFAAFVNGQLSLVYGAALRRVGGDAQLAQDVTQMVFTAASRDAARLAVHPDLTGWLFTTTRFLAAKVVRTERRRQLREAAAWRERAADEPGEEMPERLHAVLDEVLLELQQLDRQMLLMRFYRGLRLAEIGAQINSSENAVQKRIERALERLKARLSQRGITSTATALAFVLEGHGAVTIPSGLATAATTAGLACGAPGAGALAVSGTATAAKVWLGVAVAAVAVTVATVGWYQRENTRLRDELAAATAPQPAAALSKAPRASAPAMQSSAIPPSAPTSADVTASEQRAEMRNENVALATAAAPVRPAARVAVTAADGKIPLKIDYPKPLFAGTPRPFSGPNLDLTTGSPRELLVPVATRLLSRAKPVTSSDPLPVIGDLAFVTDGNKSGVDGTYLELGPGLQWIQIDLGASVPIHAVALWHFHAQPRIYHDVVVQVSDDKDFKQAVVTIFNNDHDNSARFGRGRDLGYIETFRGRVIDGRGRVGRYVRLYSNGNTSDVLNHYCEVEVYGEAGRP